MRWQVQGTDAETGRFVELGLDEPEAAQAIKRALERRIVVERIDRAHRPLRRVWAILGWALCAAAGAGCGILWMQNQQMQGELNQALAEQSRLGASVAQAQNVVADLRDHGNLGQGEAEQVRKLADDLSAVRSRMSFTEQELTAAQKRSDELEAAARTATDLEKQAADLQGQLADMQGKLRESQEQAREAQTQMALEEKRMDQQRALAAAANAGAAAGGQSQADQDLSAQMDKLKQELLETTARLAAAQQAAGDAAQTAPAAPETATPALARWAIKQTYDEADAYLLLHVDRGTLSSAAADGGLVTTTGAIPENAATLRIVHDRGRERVYQVGLSISFAADAPKDKLAENARIAGDFLKAFAPGVKGSGGPGGAAAAGGGDFVATVTGALAGKDGGERLVFLAENCRLTVWNNGDGVFTFRVDSSHGEAE